MISNNYHKLTQLDDDLWAIEDVKSSEHSIGYLLCGQNKAIVFDTGLGMSPVLPLIQKITNLPLLAALSHWHFDHSGGAHEFEDVLGWGSANMQTASEHGIGYDVIQSQVGPTFWTSIGKSSLETNGFPQITFIEKEQTINIGGYELQILHTPGHSRDSICLYEPQKKWLFSGDVAYPGPIYLQFEDSSVEEYMQTIDRLCSYDIATIFPGHNATKVSGDILQDIKEMLTSSHAKSKNFPRLAIKY